MNWYLTVLKRYAKFSGRASRKEFWWFTLIHSLIAVILITIDIRMGNLYVLTSEGMMTINSLDDIQERTDVVQVFGKLLIFYLFATLLPNLAVSVRRLHDSGKSGWLLLIGLIPLLNIFLIIFFIIPGDRNPNHYGPPANTKNKSGKDSVAM